ncbi:hypothetical protein XENOCAPTIV_017220 [Xenoophorus captivus]|uniref:Ig-like domain-containing protein n=1 Tax=Xenoophorus captivus TaxID=1517983 RepID=A0ABV0RT15_9TELE
MYTRCTATATETTVFIFLPVSPSRPEADPTKDGDVTLICSLERFSGLGLCPENNLLWVDETGTGLTAEGVGYKFRRPKSCASSLTVQHQSGTNRTYTCRFVVEDSVKVEAHYTAVFKGMMAFK